MSDPNEFICAECGINIWRAIPLTENEPRLCATCIALPGWGG
jgi:UDP-N-acetyl-D-mannosaminuronate dehydrogenase